ncbi:MAG TPA: hypothetical protein DHL02_13075 [Achromobacter sp.]|nr:hypothetical protein [Achromobacter sp.]
MVPSGAGLTLDPSTVPWPGVGCAGAFSGADRGTVGGGAVGSFLDGPGDAPEGGDGGALPVRSSAPWPAPPWAGGCAAPATADAIAMITAPSNGPGLRGRKWR